MKKDNATIFHFNEKLFIEPGGGIEGFSAVVVGLKLRYCLILDCTSTGSISGRLKPNDVVWVRRIRETTVRFSSKVLNIINEPIPLMVLEYPENEEEIEYRRSVRNKVFIRSDLFSTGKSEGKSSSWTGYILDISESGCLMSDDFIHPMNYDLVLAFRIPLIGAKIEAKARVVRSEVTDTGIRSGLEFIDLGSEKQSHLKESLNAFASYINALS